ncbi:carbohydrate ABC transporter substrate-binding protein, CUT1 family [Bradyrhizobium sp. Ghvi]|uniref:ABC transporter substrate-binding protein n=1 Tax=Bradyrhizobium sp. Ghvi TaxID=1855319 RepID=UPI0008F05C35|nr:ABC transporter substrate-binding protein [Bradyrhizobium sp. Ghvi]SFP22749.1 carbohydrate ABC transporter substrate-binding protein, CUT1 family [Bradyrhizobium sp. Ghvi]
MKRTLFASVAIVAAAWASVPVSAEEMKAEVIHWWTSGGEAAAVKVFADQFTKAGGTWIDSAVAGAPNARNAAISRTVAGNPPTAMQLNTGKQFDELVEGDLLADVDVVATEDNWKGVMPAAIVAAATRNGKMYAVPVNIHGQNWLWYNKTVLASVGAAEPKTWNDALAILEKLKVDGKVIPLAFSGQKNWEQNLFNAVMIGVGGAQMWTGILGKRDAALAGSAEFKAVAVTYKKLKDYVDAGAPGRNWNDATNLVIQGKAGMQIMGDWAKGEFVAADKIPDKDYGCTVLSNGSGGYIMGGDVFVFPKAKDPSTTKAQMTLAKLMLTPETQIQFALKKGSIPVRGDVDTSALDACAQKGMRYVADKAQQMPSGDMLAPPALIGALQDAISQYWNTNMSADEFSAKVAAVLKSQE